jgi:LysW-gamma-L-lysine carboxypeptidase
VTLGYKGRLLAHVTLRQAMAHSAGPGASACERAVELWLRMRGRIAELNAGKERVWDQVQPSLRSFFSDSDGLQDIAQMTLGFRLPLDVGPEAVSAELLALAGEAELRFEGAEPAFRSDKNNVLVRAFLATIRSQGEQPGFVLKTGTSDMNVVGPRWQCPIVAYGPGDSSLDHTPDEHVAIEDWSRGVAVLVDVLNRVVKGL